MLLTSNVTKFHFEVIMIVQLIHKVQTALLVASFFGAGAASACDAVNFRTMTIPGDDPAPVRALLAAYRGLSYANDAVVMPDGTALPMGVIRNVLPAERLTSATISEQFYYTYPLAFDLTQRRKAWEDPGRLRNDAFFRALYFADKAAARKTLSKVSWSKGASASFYMTGKYQVACQLAAVFAALEAEGTDFAPFFRKSGGSFNWRVISGTDRLSAHSFGIAIDLNTELGGYWKWSGAKPGHATEYNNKVPQTLVQAFETYGFIWGGKWHHFDGMHFEYRPEMILYARLIDE